ncbi:MAG: hypothetical protein ACK6BS_07780 [Pseudanabaena sp.]
MQKKKDKETGGINNPSPKGDRYYCESRFLGDRFNDIFSKVCCRRSLLMKSSNAVRLCGSSS